MKCVGDSQWYFSIYYYDMELMYKKMKVKWKSVVAFKYSFGRDTGVFIIFSLINCRLCAISRYTKVNIPGLFRATVSENPDLSSFLSNI